MRLLPSGLKPSPELHPSRAAGQAPRPLALQIGRGAPDPESVAAPGFVSAARLRSPVLRLPPLLPSPRFAAAPPHQHLRRPGLPSAPADAMVASAARSPSPLLLHRRPASSRFPATSRRSHPLHPASPPAPVAGVHAQGRCNLTFGHALLSCAVVRCTPRPPPWILPSTTMTRVRLGGFTKYPLQQDRRLNKHTGSVDFGKSLHDRRLVPLRLPCTSTPRLDRQVPRRP